MVYELSKLQRKPWWSPNTPESYILDWGVGLGKVAHEDYGAFNLVWAGYPLESRAQHVIAVEAFNRQKVANEDLVFDTPLSEWLTLMNPVEFKVWYLLNGDELSETSRVSITRALDGLVKIHGLQL